MAKTTWPGYLNKSWFAEEGIGTLDFEPISAAVAIINVWLS